MSIKKNLVYNFILSVSQVVLPLISIPYISRVLDPAGIGKVSFIDSFTFYFISLAEFGIVVYGMREIARVKDDPAEKNKLVSELIALHILSSTFTLIVYFVSIGILWSKIEDIRLVLFSLSFLIVNFFACEWYFIGMERFKYITIRSLLVRLFGLILIFLLVKTPPDYYIYYAIIAGSGILISIWNNLLLFREVKITFKGINYKRHIRNTLTTYFISIVYGVMIFLDTVLLRLVTTSTAIVAFYAFAVKMSRISTGLLTDSLLVFFPRIVSTLRENDQSKVQTILLKNLQLLFLASIPLSFGIFLLAEPLVLLFLGDKFVPAIDNLKILSVLPVLKAYNLFLSKQVLITHNHEQLYLKSLVITCAVFIVSILLLGYFFQDFGASLALVMAELVLLLINYYYVRRIAPALEVFDSRTFLQAIAGSVSFIAIIYLIRQAASSAFIQVASGFLGCVIIYWVTMVLIIKHDFMISIQSIVKQLLSKEATIQS